MRVNKASNSAWPFSSTAAVAASSGGLSFPFDTAPSSEAYCIRVTAAVVLSFLAYGDFGATVYGLNDFPQDQWPDNVELLYYCYHIMVGLGTIFLAVMAGAVFLLWRGWLSTFRP